MPGIELIDYTRFLLIFATMKSVQTSDPQLEDLLVGVNAKTGLHLDAWWGAGFAFWERGLWSRIVTV